MDKTEYRGEAAMENEVSAKLISGEEVKLIIKSIDDAKTQYKDYVKREKLVTQNGKYHEMWNYIFTNIEKSFNEFPYKCYKISRQRLWEFIVIHDQINYVLYVIMKENNFEKIRNAKGKDLHYIKILNLINPFKIEKSKQISLFPDDESKEEYIKNDLDKMLKDIDGKVKVCVDVLYSEKQNKVTSISGKISDYDLDEIKSYCWNEFITADINEIIDTNDEYEVITEPIELHVRDHVKRVKEHEEDTKDIIASKETQKKNLEGK